MSSTVRVALIADTHGFLDPRVSDRIRGFDVVVHAGDIGSSGVLEALGNHALTIAIRGNNDVGAKWPSQEIEALSELPWVAELDLPGGRLVAVHGHQIADVKRRHQRLRRTYPDARAIVYGHSHRLCIESDESPWIVNPGAAGRARTHGGPSLCLLSASERRWRVRGERFEPLPR